MVRRFHSRRKRTFKRPFRRTSRRTFKRRFNIKRKNRPTTARVGWNMKDRTFQKFKYVTLTTCSQAPFSLGDGYGLRPYNQTIGDPVDKFVFYPSYANVWEQGALPNTTVGHNNAGAFYIARILPGNSLSLVHGAGATVFTSDSFRQRFPTGLVEAARWYENAVVHGSAVTVSLINTSLSAGKLIVIPVQLDQGGATPYAIDGSVLTDANWQNLLRNRNIPSEQKYAKTRLVSAAGGMDKVILKHSMTTRKLCNTKDLQDDDNNLVDIKTMTEAGAPIPSGPGDPTQNSWGWYISFVPAIPFDLDDLPLGGGYPTIEVKITYYCELIDRRTIGFTATSSA